MGSIIGVVSDTQGIIRPEMLDALSTSSQIVHAGNVGAPDVLEALERIAPVTAVRGNADGGTFGESLPHEAILEVESVRIYVIHDLSELEYEPAEKSVHAVISGFGQLPSIETREGVLYVNPGSAGPRRFSFPVTVARLRVDGDEIDPEIVHLMPG